MTTMLLRRLALLALVASCGQESIGVAPAPARDYGHTALDDAVAKFVAAGRTPQAFGELAAKVATLRPEMDEAVAREAERKLLVVALAPMKSYATKPMSDQINALALTVWPLLLAPAIEADALLQVPDAKAPQYAPKPGETPTQYLERLCGGVLAADCKQVVPEYQGEVVEALAIRRATERVRNAVSDCLECTGANADPRWHEAVEGWEGLDRAAATDLPAVEQKADPTNWPVAGAAADDDPDLPEVEIAPGGTILLDGHTYGPNQQRIGVLREVRGNGDAVAMHLHPQMTLAEVRGVLLDARKAGCARVAVIAREPFFPWNRKAYWIAAGSGMRANLRPSDSLQLLLHAIDEVAGPGTVARVD